MMLVNDHNLISRLGRGTGGGGGLQKRSRLKLSLQPGPVRGNGRLRVTIL
jgi:hypothetical protein